MNSSSTVPLSQRDTRDVRASSASSSSTRAHPTRYFYLGAAALLLLLVFLGFQRFYLHGQTVRRGELFGPVRELLIVHGTVMTGWVVLFFTQSLLVARQNRQLHMKLGILGAVLAAAIVVLGPYTAIQTAQRMPDIVRTGLHSRPFLAIQFGAILHFGLFVAIGLWQRRRADIHRPMMLLATLAIMGAATARIEPLRNLYRDTFWEHVFGSYFIPLVIGLLFLAIKTALTRSFDRWLAGGVGALIASSAVIIAVAHTEPWARLMETLFP
jgi:hypothetical protein